MLFRPTAPYPADSSLFKGGAGASAEESRLGRLESRQQFDKTFRFNAEQAALQQQRAEEQMAATRQASRFTVKGSETAADKARAADEARRAGLAQYGFRNTRYSQFAA